MTAGVVNDVGDRISEKENVSSVVDLSVNMEIVAVVNLSVEKAIPVDNLVKPYLFTEAVAEIPTAIIKNYNTRYLETDYQPDLSINIRKEIQSTDKYTGNLRHLHRLTHSLSC